jgi:hypothetical protein
MIKKVVLNGRIETLLVLTEEMEYYHTNPFAEVLNSQEERIEALERQNIALIEQGENLLNLLESSMEGTAVMAEEAMESLREAESVLMEYEEQMGEDLMPPELEKK